MSEVKVDTISERTAAGGVTIDGVLVKDGTATFQTAAGSPLVFEGATADAYETTFAITDPTADRTITFPDADVTLGAAGTNTPSFGAYLAANQTYSNDTWTKITFNTELWDTDSAFDHSTNYRFTVPDGESGKYFFSATTNYDDTGGVVAVGTGHMALYKNGVNLQNHLALMGGTRWTYLGATVTTVIELSDNGAGANDYIEFYAYMNQNAATGVSMGGQLYTFCSGFKLL